MCKKGVVFSDIDGSLYFHAELHGIRHTGKDMFNFADGVILEKAG